MSVSYGGDSIVFADGSVNSSGFIGHRNRIINGAMVIDQRNAGASVTPTDGAYTLDRWSFAVSQTSKLTTQQNAGAVTPPAGFSNYLGITSSSAYTLLAGDYFALSQKIEGFNFADMAWGTASAATVTLSFWVRSSLTGTFGGTLNNSAFNRNYPFAYTISSANTWEQKSVTVTGDTSGTWVGATSGIGLSILFGLGIGSTYSGTSGAWTSSTIFAPTGATSVVGTNGATFYITGVQLERGSTASSFEYRSYGAELALCQRYYQKLAGGTVVGSGATDIGLSIPFTLPMRSAPSVGQTGVLTIENMGTSDITQSSTSISIRSSRINTVGGVFSMSNFSGLTQFRPYLHNVNHNGTDNYITLTAEL
jgi:hypothetical protein